MDYVVEENHNRHSLIAIEAHLDYRKELSKFKIAFQ